MAGEYGDVDKSEVPSGELVKVEAESEFWKFIGSEKFKNLNRVLFNTLLLLAIYFLGANAMIWTVDQVKVYSDQLCDYSSFNRINTTLINVSSWSDSGVIQGG